MFISLLARTTLKVMICRHTPATVWKVLTALQIAKEVVGAHGFGLVLGEAEARVQKGEPLSASFVDHPNLYPPLMADMLAVGEETGQPAKGLNKLAEYYERQIQRFTKTVTSLIEPILILILGSVVGFVVLAMLMPIFRMNLLVK